MKRKEIDRRLTQLLDRIDRELAEIRDGLIEVDHRAAKAARDVDVVTQYAKHTNLYSMETRDMLLTAFEDNDQSRKAEPS